MARPKKYDDKYIKALTDELLAWFKITTNYWLKDFCIEKGFSSQRLSEFALKNEEFAEALKMAKDIQESKLVKMGLSKDFNATMVIFALKNVAGWRDQEKESGLSETEIVKLRQIANSQIEANI